jgi:hypothetical protein
MPVAVFQLAHNDWIDPSAIMQERYIICAAWRWEGEDEVQTVSVLDDLRLYKKNPHDDYHVVKVLRDVLAKADTIVHHNGDKFDKRYVDTRVLMHGFDPLPPVNSVDTYKVAKSRFLLSSNKLDYIGKFLKVGEKVSTTPGLWMRVLNGDSGAVKEMVTYNVQDVVLLQGVYNKLKPYVITQTSREFFGETGCPRCGSQKIQSRGTHKAITRTYQRFQCMGCGGWFKHLKADKDSSTQYRVI